MGIEIISTEVDLPGGGSILVNHPERFHKLKYIGHGSFGNVVLAKDRGNGNSEVAIKSISIPANPALGTKTQIKRLIREITILHHSLNPQIVDLKTVYMDLDSSDKPTCVNIVMSYCGISLESFIKSKNPTRDGPDDLEKFYRAVKNTVYNIARGINFLFEAMSIYHRDLKPKNICIDKNDRKFPVKIIDLGMSRVKPSSSGKLTRDISTKAYMAPEMLLGLKYYDTLDVWSLGCILGYLFKFGEDIFAYNGSELSMRAGTIRKIVEIVGKPSAEFMTTLKENELLKEFNDSEKIDRRTFDFLKELCDDKPDVHPSVLEAIFPDTPDNPQLKVDAVNLMRGMLQWDRKDRWTIRQVLDSDFLKAVRDVDSEALPDPVTCQTITDSIKRYEERLSKTTSVAETIDTLFAIISEDFGYDKDVDGYYDYVKDEDALC